MSRTTIRIAAQMAGVGIETIRFYERRGLIEQPTKPLNGGHRDYPPETVKRIRFIREAQDLGFSLHEVDELLSLQADPSADCAQVRERARSKLTEVDQKISQLSGISRALNSLILACPGKGSLSVCSIIDALDKTESRPHQSEDVRDA